MMNGEVVLSGNSPEGQFCIILV